MNSIKILFCGILLIFTACTSDVDSSGSSDKVDGPVSFAVAMANDASRADVSEEVFEEQSKFLNLRFDKGDRIRIINPTRTNPIPDFFTKGSYYEYVYRDTDNPILITNNGYYYKCAFIPYADDSGFFWSDLHLTDAYYILKAAFFPIDYEPSQDLANQRVSIDQSDRVTLKKNDLMLAHKLMYVNEWGNEIELKFRHVFSMVYTKFVVPLYDPTTNTGFPRPQLAPDGSIIDGPKGCLTNLHAGYSINYQTSISSDGITSVFADTESEVVPEITMCLTSCEIDEAAKTISYNYLAIVPTQTVDYTGSTMLMRFYLKDIAGNTTRYRFIPRNTPIQMSQGDVTQLELVLPRLGVEPILINASIKPWTHAYSDMILEEI